MTKKELSKAIKKARTQKDLTQESLARLLDVSLITVQRWERESSEPSRLARKQLERILGITIC